MTAQPVEASMFSGEIHPYAAAFPMLPDDDLDALGADIKANGQRILCVLDQNGRLLDGRNRIAACDRVGVKPGFEMVTVTEDEAVALIVTANMQRRDLTQDQKAHLAVAAQYTNRIKQVDLANIAGVRQPKIAEAVIVRRFAPQSSDAVIAGDLTHQRALATARGIKDDLAEREQRRRTLDAEAPDLNWLTPDEAWAAYLERTKEQRKAAEHRAAWLQKLRDTLVESVLGAGTCAHPNNIADAIAGLAAHPVSPTQITPADIRAAADHLRRVADRMESK